MNTNKILNRAFLPKAILIGTFSVISVPPLAHWIKEDKNAGKKVEQSEAALLSMACLAILAWATLGIRDYKKSKHFSAKVARKYLIEATKSKPELKAFEKVLCNQKDLDNISTFISNSLSAHDQKMIIKIVASAQEELESYKKTELEDDAIYQIARKLFNSARADIVKIIHEHAASHPEFVSELNKIIACPDRTYIVKNPIQQHTR